MMVKPLNCTSTSRPTRACATRNAIAALTLTCPDGIGRERVRSTLASMSRSIRSFQVQPAPRITMAPIRNNNTCQGSGPQRPAGIAASAADHQHGRSSSHHPIGRSSRVSRRYGRVQAGAIVSTQFPVASATLPAVAPMSGPPMSGHRASGLPVSVSNVPRPGLGSGRAGPPNASLRLGPEGAGPAAQTCLRICCDFACWPRTVLIASGGTPQIF